jgi:hypothetical protein
MAERAVFEDSELVSLGSDTTLLEFGGAILISALNGMITVFERSSVLGLRVFGMLRVGDVDS